MKQFTLALLLLVTTLGGWAQTATYDYDAVGRCLTITSDGTLDLSSFNPKPTVITVVEGVTLTNVNGTYKGVKPGTLLDPQGGTLTNPYIDSEQVDTYVLCESHDAGTYTINQYGIGTLCFPNNVDIEGSGIRAYRAIDVQDDVLILQDAANEQSIIPAYTPVILYKNGGGELPLGGTGKVSQAPVTVTDGSDNLLVGINNTMTVPTESGSDHYLLQKQGEDVGFFPAIDKDGNQRSFRATKYRCFLSLPAGTQLNAMSIHIPDETGIDNPKHTSQDCGDNSHHLHDGFYDFNGKIVVNPRLGQPYIMCLDGRITKVIIK